MAGVLLKTSRSGSVDVKQGRSVSDTAVQYKIVVLGSSRVGKTSLIARFLYDSFTDTYTPTLEEQSLRECQADGAAPSVLLSLLDTSGRNEFPAMRELAIGSADAFLLVYSQDDEGSFDEVRRILDQILSQRRGQVIPIVVVGNKSDLTPATRNLSPSIAEATVNIDWDLTFVSTSAKNDTNVQLAFKELLDKCGVNLDGGPSRLSLFGRWQRTKSLSEPSSRRKRKACVVS